MFLLSRETCGVEECEGKSVKERPSKIRRCDYHSLLLATMGLAVGELRCRLVTGVGENLIWCKSVAKVRNSPTHLNPTPTVRDRYARHDES